MVTTTRSDSCERSFSAVRRTRRGRTAIDSCARACLTHRRHTVPTTTTPAARASKTVAVTSLARPRYVMLYFASTLSTDRFGKIIKKYVIHVDDDATRTVKNVRGTAKTRGTTLLPKEIESCARASLGRSFYCPERRNAEL